MNHLKMALNMGVTKKKMSYTLSKHGRDLESKGGIKSVTKKAWERVIKTVCKHENVQ